MESTYYLNKKSILDITYILYCILNMHIFWGLCIARKNIESYNFYMMINSKFTLIFQIQSYVSFLSFYNFTSKHI